MDDLFSCRNCIHNPVQGLSFGPEAGYCLLHKCLLFEPGSTTCKYLYRKDLPFFHVKEAMSEHAEEFVSFAGPAHLENKEPIPKYRYSEKIAWEKSTYDSLTNAIAHYPTSASIPEEDSLRVWTYIEAFASGTDGRKSYAYSALTRRYMNNCGTWTSSYRLILGFLQQWFEEPRFSDNDLNLDPDTEDGAERAEDALWEVVFGRLSTIQEYGYHSGLTDLIEVSDRLNGALVEFDWPNLASEMKSVSVDWTRLVIEHADENDEFFPESTLVAN